MIFIPLSLFPGPTSTPTPTSCSLLFKPLELYWDLPWCVVNTPEVTTIKKTDFASPQKLKAECRPPRLCWDFIWFDLYKPRPLTHILKHLMKSIPPSIGWGGQQQVKPANYHQHMLYLGAAWLSSAVIWLGGWNMFPTGHCQLTLGFSGQNPIAAHPGSSTHCSEY